MAKELAAETGHPGQPDSKGKGRRKFWTIVMVVSLVVFVAVAGFLAVSWMSYLNDSNRYQEIADSAFSEEADDLASMTVDWDALRAINPEVVAWVYIPDTAINYPVCWSGDNDKYLTANFDGESGIFTGSGTIFLDMNNRPDLTDQNTAMYGHHMNDGSMFACLSDFADAGTFEAHRTVYLMTPTTNYQFRTFSLVLTDGSDTLVVPNFATPKEMIDYVADKEARSVVTPADGFVDPKDVEKLITLSTCDYTKYDGRAILFGALEGQAVPKNAPEPSESSVSSSADGQ